jgi:hypothetical protein
MISDIATKAANIFAPMEYLAIAAGCPQFCRKCDKAGFMAA